MALLLATPSGVGLLAQALFLLRSISLLEVVVFVCAATAVSGLGAAHSLGQIQLSRLRSKCRAYWGYIPCLSMRGVCFSLLVWPVPVANQATLKSLFFGTWVIAFLVITLPWSLGVAVVASHFSLLETMFRYRAVQLHLGWPRSLTL